MFPSEAGKQLGRKSEVSLNDRYVHQRKAEWSRAFHGTTFESILGFMIEGVRDSTAGAPGCNTIKNMSGVYRFGEHLFHKTGFYAPSVTLLDDGMACQLILELSVDLSDRQQRAADKTDQRCIPERSVVWEAILVKRRDVRKFTSENASGQVLQDSWCSLLEHGPKEWVYAVFGGSEEETGGVTPPVSTSPTPPASQTLLTSEKRADRERARLPGVSCCM